MTAEGQPSVVALGQSNPRPPALKVSAMASVEFSSGRVPEVHAVPYSVHSAFFSTVFQRTVDLHPLHGLVSTGDLHLLHSTDLGRCVEMDNGPWLLRGLGCVGCTCSILSLSRLHFHPLSTENQRQRSNLIFSSSTPFSYAALDVAPTHLVSVFFTLYLAQVMRSIEPSHRLTQLT